MNKLRGLTSYLLGNIDGVSEADYRGWRKDMTDFLRSVNVLVLDPTDKPTVDFVEDEEFRQKRKKALEAENYDLVTAMMKPVRNLDLRCVDKADFLVCNIDMDGRPFGSIEEITTANRQKKPIIIHCPQGKKRLPPWAFAMMPHQLFFSTWDGVRDYISDVDSGKNTDYLSRWWFFDFTKITQGTNI